MPNWCEGILKLRGMKQDLINFVLNGLERLTNDGDYFKENRKLELISTEDLNKQLEYGDLYIKESISNGRDWVYFKESRRMFLTQDINWYLVDGCNIVELDIKQAWDITTDYLLGLAKAYHLDMKGKFFEKGMEFTREIEIVGNEIIRDSTTKYDDYEWEVYDSRLGG